MFGPTLSRHSPLLCALSLLLGCNGDDKDPLTPTGASPSPASAFEDGDAQGDDADDGDGDDEGDDGDPATTATPTADPTPDPTSETTDPTADPTTDPSTGPTTATDDSGPSGVCGDGQLDPGEDCDLDQVGGMTCQEFGFPGGDLYCSQFCAFDTSFCTSNGCGDGVVNNGEQCDCGGDSCTPDELGFQVCESFSGPGGPYSGGTLGCSPETCTRVFDQCSDCGNGEQEGDEACDGADLGGQTCAKLGLGGGTLSCTADCEFNQAKCTGSANCGDGTCQASEDSCNCAADCPDDPNSCSPCQCGGMGGPTCACDNLCTYYGDCCANGPC